MIPIRNIYYMLSYAFQVLNEQGYKNMATEEFENTADMFAAILIKGMTVLLKRGLGREYIEKSEPLTSLRGRIEITESIKTRTMQKQQLICSYDDFSVNSYMNRIIKTTMVLLARSDISKQRKKEIRRILSLLSDVELLDIHTIDWRMNYTRNNKNYEMLISICYLVIKGLLQTNSDGSTRMMDFLDEQRMCRLYEKFILGYYQKKFSKTEISASASKIDWKTDNNKDNRLPVLQTDIMLTCREKVLIIDAKYYSHTTQVNFDKHTIHSANLYQLFTYVKNKQYTSPDTHVVSGMLLYAKTDEQIQPDDEYILSGNKISVKTLDLNCEFSKISDQLNEIVNEFFGPLSCVDGK